MAKLTLNDIASGYASSTAQNTNNDLIETALENTLSRDGTTPNQMGANIDMNGYAILNALASSGNENFSWSGTWTASTAYSVNNLIYVLVSDSAVNGGATYICTAAHTSTADFDTDLATNWSLFAKRGGTGDGTGDLLASNDLSDVDSAATSRVNLGVEIGADVQAYNAGISNTPLAQGKHTIWVPAVSLIPRTTNGAIQGTVETTTNKVMISTLDFDASTDEFAQFSIRMPKSWDEGTLTFIPIWSHPITATDFGVSWFLEAYAFTNGDNLEQAFGTAVESQDTGGTTDDLYQGPESGAITVGGSPAAGDYVQFQIYRDVSDAGDTMTVDARLHGLLVFYTIDAENDT